jgi:hypothetical protein
VTGQASPFDRILAFLDPLLRLATLVDKISIIPLFKLAEIDDPHRP